MSKSLCTGWRVGFCVGNPTLVSALAESNRVLFTVLLIRVAAIAAKRRPVMRRWSKHALGRRDVL